MAIITGQDKLGTLHPDLVVVVEAIAQWWDIAVLETDRTAVRQQELVKQGKSKTLQSLHLKQSDGYAHAIDLAPLPIDWNDLARWDYFGGFALGIAKAMGRTNIFWGGDWNGNGQVKDQTFNDLDHLEIRI